MQVWLDAGGATQVVVSDELPWPDPGRVATDVLTAAPATGLRALTAAIGPPTPDAAWLKEWVSAGASARAAIDAYLDEAPIFEGTVVRSVAQALPADALLYVGTSLPIRALDAFTPATASLEAFANRGASGIDGTLSGAIGAAAATGRPVASLTGDLAFLHDVGGLLAVARHRIPLVAVVIDNGGGGIFDFLPQAEGVEKKIFDDLFATSHEIDLMRAAELYGMQFAAVRDIEALEKSLSWAFTEGRSWVIRVPVRRDASVEAHRVAWERAAEALSR
jgi:2-succinyl-5-enolpyruvyl-6-hydroxy-3-cyclohexene-1-carboxylate synthase